MIQGRFSTNETINDFSPAGAKTVRACHQNTADSKRLVFRESAKKAIKIGEHESCVRQKKFSHYDRRPQKRGLDVPT
jgi:hypothetical protein